MPDPMHGPQEYRFKIDAFTPETIPLNRLAQYLGDIARIMGEQTGVHLARLERGSTVSVLSIDWEAAPKVRERLHAMQSNEGPAEARRAYREINKRLVEDNAAGVLSDPHQADILPFPGRHAANQPEFGPIQQNTLFEGVPIRIGGEGDPVPVHLANGIEKHIVDAPRRLAKQIAQHLFTSLIRVEGKSTWFRTSLGNWEMRSFYASGFEVLQDGDIRHDIHQLRQIDSTWKSLSNPLGELEAIRSGSVTV